MKRVLKKKADSAVKPIVEISYDMHQLVRAIHNDKEWAHKEWSCYCRVEKKDGYYLLSNMYFPEQKNSKAHTEITEKGKTDFADWVIENDPENMHEWCLWMHSHNSMSVFWSGEDYDTKASFDDGVCDRFFSIVTGTRGGSDYHFDGVYYRGALDIYHPMRLEFDLEIRIGSKDESMCGEVDIDLEGLKKQYMQEHKVKQKIAAIKKEKAEALAQLEDIGNDEESIAAVKELINMGDVDITPDIDAQIAEYRKSAVDDTTELYDELIKDEMKAVDEYMTEKYEEFLKESCIADRVEELRDAEVNISVAKNVGRVVGSRFAKTGKGKREIGKVEGDISETEVNKATQGRRLPEDIFLYKNGDMYYDGNIYSVGDIVEEDTYSNTEYAGYDLSNEIVYFREIFVTSGATVIRYGEAKRFDEDFGDESYGDEEDVAYSRYQEYNSGDTVRGKEIKSIFIATEKVLFTDGTECNLADLPPKKND